MYVLQYLFIAFFCIFMDVSKVSVDMRACSVEIAKLQARAI